MTAGLHDFYVYVYIDPRNYEEFYYGKGRGARRLAHLFDETDSEKVARIRAIRKEGSEPIVRTIAAGLTEPEALLIETTLIWGSWARTHQPRVGTLRLAVSSAQQPPQGARRLRLPERHPPCKRR